MGIKGTKVECKLARCDGSLPVGVWIKGTKVECKSELKELKWDVQEWIKGTKVECKFPGYSLVPRPTIELKELK